ncbi:MAG: ornithine cyclodeaminase family protein [Chloroflexi bacterium]|nr:ornithine cyclodeaminase family protein [Chloroflexota bacterium]
MRTGAASGIATKYMANPEAKSLAVIGTGWQAESQILAINAVRDLTAIRVYSRDEARREAFAKRMQAQVGVTVTASVTAEEAVRGAAIVATITSARTPVLLGEWLSDGAHVNAAGSNALSRAEIDDDVVRRAQFIATDSNEQARIEGGDLISAVERNIITWEQVRELGDVVSGRLRSRMSPHDVTLFKSHGIAIEDIATARRVLELAHTRGIGQELAI